MQAKAKEAFQKRNKGQALKMQTSARCTRTYQERLQINLFELQYNYTVIKKTIIYKILEKCIGGACTL